MFKLINYVLIFSRSYSGTILTTPVQWRVVLLIYQDKCRMAGLGKIGSRCIGLLLSTRRDSAADIGWNTYCPMRLLESRR